MSTTMLRIGIPVFCEREWLPRVFESLAAQTDLGFEVWVCVNQPASFFNDPDRADITRQNLETLAWLQRQKTRAPFVLRVFDAVRPPLAASDSGVGWARRFLFDQITDQDPDSLCISLDADTLVEPEYIARLRAAFNRYPNAVGMAVPYRHRLPDDRDHALRLLRYEIYMRYYQLSLWRIGSPYAFLALGSAMVFRGRAYRKAGGMPVRKAGEDFYFLQRLRKIGPVIRWLDSKVYPSARPSKRVPFGTGPLMSEPDLSLQMERFPFYRQTTFDLLGETFARLPDLHRRNLELPIHDFIVAHMNGHGPFEKMRRNFSDEARFVRSCHDRLDGLKTLQVLRYYQPEPSAGDRDDSELNALLKKIGKPAMRLEFSNEVIGELNRCRNMLAEYEAEFQKAFMDRWQNDWRW